MILLVRIYIFGNISVVLSDTELLDQYYADLRILDNNTVSQLFSLGTILPTVKCNGNETINTINLRRIFCKRMTLADLQPQIIFCACKFV